MKYDLLFSLIQQPCLARVLSSMALPPPPIFDPQKHKNQHFVPQLWQKRFANSNGTVWARYRESADPISDQKPRVAGKARQINIESTMTADWTYTIFDKWYRPSNEIEEHLSGLEGHVAYVFDQVSDPNFVSTGQIVKDLVKAFGLAACRTPEVMRRGHRRAKELAETLAKIRSYQDKNAFMSHIQEEYGIIYSDEDYKRILLNTDKELQDEAEWIACLSPQDPNLPEQIALDAAENISNQILSMSLTILYAPNSYCFILGDTPLPDADLSKGFVVPISKNVALRAEQSDHLSAGSLSKRACSESEVSDSNRKQYEMSRDVVIGPDREVLDAL